MWIKFKDEKPKRKGWYLCNTKVSGYKGSIIKLYWYPHEQRFVDVTVKKILDNYVVVKSGKRITDLGQDRTDYVVAWRLLPKPYIK